jgi:hypothetical protein
MPSRHAVASREARMKINETTTRELETKMLSTRMIAYSIRNDGATDVATRLRTEFNVLLTVHHNTYIGIVKPT